MKSAFFLTYLTSATILVDALTCDYSGLYHGSIGKQPADGKETTYGRSWNYLLGVGARVSSLSYQRNATDTYETLFGYNIENSRWALKSGLLTNSDAGLFAVLDADGNFGMGAFLKSNWENKLKQAEKNKPEEVMAGVRVALEAAPKSATTNKKINGMDVLQLDFDGLLQNEMTFILSDLDTTETALYRTYKNGKKQDEGTINGSVETTTEHVVSSALGYDAIEFYVQNDNPSDFLMKSVEYCAPKSCDRNTMHVAQVAGDPHVESFDGLKWDCQGSGLFQSFLGTKKDNTDFQIQSIFEKTPSGRQLTLTRAVVIDPNEQGVPAISISVPRDNTDGCFYTVYDSIHGTTIDYTRFQPFSSDAIFLKVKEPRSGRKHDALEFSYLNTHTEVEITMVDSKLNGCYLNVAVCLGSEYWGDDSTSVTGLMGGKPDDDQTNDWVKNDGTIQEFLKNETKAEEAFDFCVSNWCIDEGRNSKFTYPVEGKSFEEYNGCVERYDEASDCSNIEDDSDYEHIVEVCKQFFNHDEILLENCYTEGCNGDVDGIVEWFQAITELNETKVGDVIDEIYEAGGSKTKPPTPAPTDPSGVKIPPTKKPGVNGDPHFKTWSGQKYDYHGVCDLVLLSHPGFSDGLGMEIHIRSKKTLEWSYISTAVVHIGSETFEVAGMKDGNTRWLNMIEVKEGEWDKNTAQIAGYPIKYEDLLYTQRQYVIELGNDEFINLKTWKDMVRVDVVPNPQKETFGGSLGLMGSYPDGAMLGRDGETEIAEHDNFGQEWQVLSYEPKVFHVVDGPQHPSRCESPNKSGMRRRLAQSKISRKEAEIACTLVDVSKEEFDLCVFDVMAIGDRSAAGAY